MCKCNKGKDSITVQWVRGRLWSKWCWYNCLPIWKKIKLGSCLKINPRWIKALFKKYLRLFYSFSYIDQEILRLETQGIIRDMFDFIKIKAFNDKRCCKKVNSIGTKTDVSWWNSIESK